MIKAFSWIYQTRNYETFDYCLSQYLCYQPNVHPRETQEQLMRASEGEISFLALTICPWVSEDAKC